MHGTVIEHGITAIKGTPASGSETSGGHEPEKITPASWSNPHEWFYATAQKLLGKDAGFALHIITKYPASTCYAYVTKDEFKRSRPKEHFLRVLFRDEQVGELFHDAFMADCPWWNRRKREAAIGRQVLEITNREP
jgi:hypothetical protein